MKRRPTRKDARSQLRGCVSIFALITAVGLAASPVAAQSLSEALAQAYRTNPQLDAQRATLRATDEDVARANAGYRPSISGNADVTYSDSTSRPASAAGTGGESHSRGFGVSLSQPIFQGFRTLNAVRAAEANVRAGRETLRAIEQTVLLAAVTAYMDVVRDEAIVNLNQNNINVLSNQLRATRDQFAVGEVTRTDVAQAEARRAAATSSLELARANLESSRATFERIVGSPPRRLRSPSEPTARLPRSVQEAIRVAVRENPNLVNSLYLEQAARISIQQIRGELLPTVTLDASYSKRFDPTPVTDQSENTSVTGRVNVPIYSGGSVYARVRAAKHTHVARLQQIEQVRAEQQALVVSAWARLNAARAQRVSAASAVSANTTALTGVREEYRVGQRTLLDVLDAEQELLNSRVTQVTAGRDAIVQAYTLLATMGRLSAQEIGVAKVVYDPEVHYHEVRRKWWGLSITRPDGTHERLDLWPTHGKQQSMK